MRKKMKTTITVAAVLMALSVTACSSGGNTSGSGGASTEAQTTQAQATAAQTEETPETETAGEAAEETKAAAGTEGTREGVLQIARQGMFSAGGTL